MGISDKEKGPFEDPSSVIEVDCPSDRGKLIPLAVHRGSRSDNPSRKAAIARADRRLSQLEATIASAARSVIDTLVSEFGLDPQQVIFDPESKEYSIRMEGEVKTVREYIESLLAPQKPSISVPLKDVPRWTTRK